MKDWLVIAGDVTPFGGMDRANHALVGALARRSGQVRVVAHQVQDDLAHHEAVHWGRVARPLGSHLLGAPLLARAGERAARAARPGTSILANGGNAVVDGATWIHYVHAAHEPSAAGLRHAVQGPLVHTWYRRRERRALHRARLVICNSRRTAADVCALDVDERRVRVVYYGSDGVDFAPVTPAARAAARRELAWDLERPVVLFVGALGDRRKGFDTLFDAWTRLAGGRWDVDLAVAGTGGELAHWQRRAAASGLAPRVRFLGFRRDIARVLAAADLLVHPARYEAYGLGVHEAVCRGLPALVSAHAGIAELFPPDLSEYLIDPDDVDAVAERLRTWARDPEAARARFTRLSSTLRARTWQSMADEIVGAVEAA